MSHCKYQLPSLFTSETTQLSLPRYDTSTCLQYIVSLSLLKEKEKSLGTKATMIGDGGRGSGRSGGGG